MNTRRSATGLGAICCILLLFLHPFVLFHFHASYNFRPLQLLKYTIAHLVFHGAPLTLHGFMVPQRRRLRLDMPSPLRVNFCLLSQ